MKSPDWIEFYLGLAVAVGQKSKDVTKVGCVITDPNHRVTGIGYNAYPRGFPDDELPTNRPDPNNPDEESKYDWTIHAEKNACLNCQHIPEVGSIAYVSCICCPPCLMDLYQYNIRHVYMVNEKFKMLTPKMERLSARFVEKSKRSKEGELFVYRINPVFDWLKNIDKHVEHLRSNGVLS